MERDDLAPPSRAAFVTGFMHQWEHYKRLVFRFWWIPLLLGGAGFGLEHYLLKKAKPSFTSEGQMIVKMKVNLPNGNIYSEDTGNFYGTQIALMEGDGVRSRAEGDMRTNHPEMAPEHVSIHVSLVPKTSIFDLKATGSSPAYTQAYLQATMDEYARLKREQLESTSTSMRMTTKEELDQSLIDLNNSKQAVLDYQSNNPIVLLQPTEGNTPADNLAELTHQLVKSKADLQLKQGLTLDEKLVLEQSGGAQQGDGKTPANAPPKGKTPTATVGIKGANTVAITTTNSDGFLGNLPSNLGANEQDYILAQKQLMTLKNRRAALIADPTRPLTFTNTLDTLDASIAQEKQELDNFRQLAEAQEANKEDILRGQILQLEKMVKDAETNALDASKKTAVFNEMKDNQKREQAHYDEIRDNMQRLKMDEVLTGEGVGMHQAAGPAMMVPPEDTKHLVVAVITGMLLGVGILLFLDRLDDRAWTHTELEQLFDHPVLGQFPLLKVKRDGTPILRLNDDRYPVIESYRSMRSALLYRNAGKEQPKSIMITSARPSDGKSTVSSNFAVTLAMAGAHVLLIDADLRRGVLHKNFSVGASPGLSEILGGRCDWGAAIVPTVIPNLHVLPCGKYVPDPGNLFATAGKYLAEIPRNYDYYIFDTVPVMVGDDVLSLAPHVDALIMVIRAGFTSGRLAKAALNSLEARQVKVVGLVFNGVKPGGSDYYHYKFKDYYPRTAR
jgi:polysaccharide biosynthesis transport protein